MRKLTQEEKDKWLVALRSGQYKQTKGILKLKEDGKEPAYCCLGVLCEVIGFKSVSSGTIKYTNHDPYPAYALLPGPIQETLCTQNDSNAHNFMEIANWIEEHVLIDA